MKPSSLLGITLELIETLAIPAAYPSDARVGRFTRERRYLGSRDRRFVTETAWTWLRFELRARRIWRALAARAGFETGLPSEEETRALEREGIDSIDDETRPGTATPARSEERSATLRHVYWLDLLILAREGRLAWSLDEMLDASREVVWPASGAPSLAPLRERVIAGELLAPSSIDDIAQDAVERLSLEASLPDWIARILIEARGEDEAFAFGQALLQPAAVDLRVNRARKSREHVARSLEAETRRPVTPTTYSPLGLRLEGRVNLTATTASRQGWIEVQDEGSQIIALACDVRPDLRIIDACAGSGGKSLAFADLILWPLSGRPTTPPSGRIWSVDVAPRRLSELERRAVETKVAERIRILPVYPAGPLPAELPDADLVLVDAPCTGLGTLRRNPELKRRFAPEDVDAFSRAQLEILERFASRVRPGGVLVFATCSFLPAEGERVAEAFSSAHPEFIPYESRWAERNLPQACVRGSTIRIDPLTTGTDAFFLSLWERRIDGPSGPPAGEGP